MEIEQLIFLIQKLQNNFEENKKALNTEILTQFVDYANSEFKKEEKRADFVELINIISKSYEEYANKLLNEKREYNNARDKFLTSVSILNSLEYLKNDKLLELKFLCLSNAQKCDAYKKIDEAEITTFCNAGRMLIGAAKILRRHPEGERIWRNELAILVGEASYYYGEGLRITDLDEARCYFERSKRIFESLLDYKTSNEQNKKIHFLLELAKKALNEIPRELMDHYWLGTDVTDPAPLITIKEPKALFSSFNNK